MSRAIINNGGFINDPSADTTRDSFTDVNENFEQLFRTVTIATDTDQANGHERANVLINGNNITYTLVNSLTWEVGVPTVIKQNGTGFAIDGAAVTLNVIGGDLDYVDGSIYYLTKTGSSVGVDIYSVVVVAPALVTIGIACSDETTDLTTGTAKATFRMPIKMNLKRVRANVNTAPTGSVLTVDINEDGTTVLSTKLTIDASEKTSTTASTPPVISDASLADDSEITIDIDGVGSTVAGTGLKVWLIGYKA